MSDERPPSADKVRELLREVRSSRPPFNCTYCGKAYLSYAGILYHYGSNKGNFVPKCFLATTSRGVGSPCTKRKRSKKEPLTWAESQRLVEVDFEGDYVRVSIDSDLSIRVNDSDVVSQGDSQNVDEATETQNTDQIKTPTTNRRGRSETPRSKGSKSKQRSKRSKAQSNDDKETAGPSCLLKAEYEILDGLELTEAPEKSSAYYRYVEQSTEDLDDVVEYDMDEEDNHWLDLINEERRSEGLTGVPHELFEFLMDRLEKECFFESRLSDHVDTNPYNIDENAECCICNDGEAHNTNVILFCDMCNLAVHQECYGVPYIPEGQWLCRRCLHSPSCNVDCVLCPNKGGAFKQTSDGRWSHVICALWIPEVHFANTVFLEPIDSIVNVPSARWKLICYICRHKGGACIQCAKTNCYVAFHVTCAQQAGLEMKIEPPKTGDTEVRKLAYCDQHMSAAAQQKLGDSVVEVEWEEDEEEPCLDNSRKKGKAEESGFIQKARRVLEQKRSISMLPIVNIPFIPDHRLERIAARVSLHRKTQFIPKLVGYWKLKRQSRNGVPLLRRLQATSQGAHMSTYKLSEEEMESLKEQLSLWKALRHDLERARLLVELVRKREKAKKKLARLCHVILDLELCPLKHILLGVLEQLKLKDPADIFAEPVPLDEVRDYADVIKHPMDFSTMNAKIMSGQYQTLEEFEVDFNLVWGNAMIYNQKETVYYKAAVRIRDAGRTFLQEAAKAMELARIDPTSGLHVDFEEPIILPSKPLSDMYPDSNIMDESILNDLIEDDEPLLVRRHRHMSLSMEEQHELLKEQLAIAQTIKNPASRHSKEKNLRREIGQLRRQMKQQSKKQAEEVNSPRSTHGREGLVNHVLQGSLRLTASRHLVIASSGMEVDLNQRTELNQGLPLITRADDADKTLLAVNGDDLQTEGSGLLSQRRVRKPTEKGVSMVSVHKRAVNRELTSHRKQKGVLKSAERTILKKAKKIKLKKNKQLKDLRSNNKRIMVVRNKTDETEDIRSPASLVSPVSIKSPTSSEDGTSRRLRGRPKKSISLEPAHQPSTANSYFPGSEMETILPSGASETELTARTVPSKYCAERRQRSISLSSAVVKQKRKRKSHLEQWDRQLFGRKRRTQSLSSDLDQKCSRVDDKLSAKDTHDLRTRSRTALHSTSNGIVSVHPSLSDLKQLDEHDSKEVLTECLNNGNSGLQNTTRVNQKPEYVPEYFDVVWAKCKGFKPYPALVVDPNIPEDGIQLGHSVVPSPSAEVLNARTDPEHYLVRFFDARKSWQWLPVSKLQLLGEGNDIDQAFIAKSGQSKASVVKAYDRSVNHLRQIDKFPQTSRTTSDVSSGRAIKLCHYSLSSEGQDIHTHHADSPSDLKADSDEP